MSARAKLAAKLPGDRHVNGIDPYATQLADRWEQEDPDNPATIMFIGLARVRKVEHLPSDDGRIRVPTLEITRIEALGVTGQEPMDGLPLIAGAHSQMLLTTAEERTGEAPLPIDAESVDEAGIDIELNDED